MERLLRLDRAEVGAEPALVEGPRPGRKGLALRGVAAGGSGSDDVRPPGP